MNNCPNCGNSIQPGVTVCPVCNTPVGSTPTPTPVQPAAPAPTAPAQPAVQPMNPAPTPMQPMGPGPVPMGQPMYNQQPPKKNNAVLIAVIGIVIIAIGVGLVLLLTKDSGGSGGNETPPEEKKQTVISCSYEQKGVGKETDSGYLTDNVVTRLDGVLVLESAEQAQEYCEQAKQNVTSPTTVTCSGNTITVTNIQGNSLIGKTADEFRSYYKSAGWICN
jgi:hypothetical protein